MLQQSSLQDEARLTAMYDVARITAIGILLGLAAMFVLPMIFGGRVDFLALFLAQRQDLPLVWVFMLAALLRLGPKPDSTDFLDHGRLLLIGSVVIILIAGWAGNYLVFRNVGISRDENMAIFDQQIFSRGALMWPIPIEWRDMLDPLNRLFTIVVGANEYWVSGYLPLNSAARALVALVADPALTSPLFVILGAVSIWFVARKLWPDSQRAAALAVVLMVTSSQVLITSMTPFAMSMHLGLNLLWLALFLKDRRHTHVAAAAVGFLATGIHQPLFHPLFALPFFVLLLTQRRWRLLLFYGAAYSLIAAFWVWWPGWILSQGTSPSAVIQCSEGMCSSVSIFDRLLELLRKITAANLWLTSANLLRFVTWQHPILLPLAIFGVISCWRAEPIVRALAAGLLLPILFLAIVLPWQGHGWGYRYVHPVLGNAILLACYGFHRIETSGLSLRRPLILTTAAAALLLVVHGVMAARLAAPYAQLRNELATIDADVVIVDTGGAPFGPDVVVNRFDLSNRPKFLIAKLVKVEDIPELCRHSSIGFFDGPRMRPLLTAFTDRSQRKTSDEAKALRAAAIASGCRITVNTSVIR